MPSDKATNSQTLSLKYITIEKYNHNITLTFQEVAFGL